jgi:hypothetical protein
VHGSADEAPSEVISLGASGLRRAYRAGIRASVLVAGERQHCLRCSLQTTSQSVNPVRSSSRFTTLRAKLPVQDART